jgi:hypothetical protein
MMGEEEKFAVPAIRKERTTLPAMMKRTKTTITCHDDVEDAGLPLCPHLVC